MTPIPERLPGNIVPHVITPCGARIYVLCLSGTDREIGRQRGRALAGDMALLWGWMRPRISGTFGLTEARWDEVGGRCVENMERRTPWLMEQIRGMAETGGMTVRDLALVNCYGLI
jgi:hypothetical protein